MDAKVASESGTRARTRRAILDAAAEVLPADSSASLADVAAAANVGRSTLHRYFPERIDLIRALARHALAMSGAAVERAGPDRGDPFDALRRVAEEHFDLGPVYMYLYTEPLLGDDAEFWEAMESDDDPLEHVLERAKDRLDPSLSTAWIRSAFWALLYTGWENARQGRLARHEVIDATMTTLTKGVLRADDPK